MRQEPGADVDKTARLIVDAAFAVHKTLGPGLLESDHEQCLALELIDRGASVARQSLLPLRYRGHVIEAAFRTDLLVDSLVIVEVKAIDALASIHSAQLLTYLKLSSYRLGLLINCNTVLLKDGIKRLIA